MFSAPSIGSAFALITNRFSRLIFALAILGCSYFGMRGDRDREALEEAFEDAQHLYKAEFGDWMRDFEPA